jgi:hypothetical protein
MRLLASDDDIIKVDSYVSAYTPQSVVHCERLKAQARVTHIMGKQRG